MQNIFKTPGHTKKELNNFIAKFNWKKASNIVKEKISDYSEPYNPWLLNKNRLIEKICTRKAAVSYFNQAYVYSVPITLLIPKLTGIVTENEGPQLDSHLQVELKKPKVLSSFIPENQNILNTDKILLKKYETTLIYTSESTGIMCTYSSGKKISLEYILLPIYIEDI